MSEIISTNINENEHYYIDAYGYIAELRTERDALQAKLDIALDFMLDIYAEFEFDPDTRLAELSKRAIETRRKLEA